MIYNQDQWNQLVQQMRGKNQNSIQEVMLPLTNIQQKNPISIINTTNHRLDESIIDGIPQNIQFNFKNKGFFNNYNSNLSFQIPIKITGLPSTVKQSPVLLNGNSYIDYTTELIQTMEDTDVVYYNVSDKIIYQIVLYNNYICLKWHFNGYDQNPANDPFTEPGKYIEQDMLIRLYKIPPSPAAYLDNVLLQKNNMSNNVFNDMYKDIFRKQCINNQIIQQDFSDFMQHQYAYVSHNQILDATEDFIEGNVINTDQIKILAEYISTTDKPISEIEYNYQVSIPLVYFHPFFQLAYNTPMELLNDELTMIMNFNMPIFSACYMFHKQTDLRDDDIFNKINVEFTGINDMKIILFKDALMSYRTIEQSKDGIYYLIYRNSDYAQYQIFDKYDNIVLQNVIPKLNSLDIIQMSLFDRKQYESMPNKETKQINNMDYYLGYSSLFNTQDYIQQFGKTWIVPNEYKNVDQFTLHDISISGLNTDICDKWNQSDQNITMCSFGDVQISIDDRNIIPYTYQTLEDVYKTNISLYDVADNKFAPNAHWDYPYYLRYFNTYIYKFDQKYGQKEKLQQPSFRGLTVSGAKSNIITRLYNYNNNGNPPHQITYSEFQDGFYNNDNLDAGSSKWIDTQLSCEFIYYYSSLYLIAGGDLIQISEQETANILKNIPFYNETDYKIAQALPVFMKLSQDEMKNNLLDEMINKLRQGAVEQQMNKEDLKQMTMPTQGIVGQQPTVQQPTVQQPTVQQPTVQQQAVDESFRQGGQQIGLQE